MPRKKLDPQFIHSVPDLIEEFRSFMDLSMKNPAIPFPWPPYVSKPERLNETIKYLDRVYKDIGDESIRSGGQLTRARKLVKTSFSQLVRHVALSFEGPTDLRQWPGFDLTRNDGESRCGRRYRAVPPRPRSNHGREKT